MKNTIAILCMLTGFLLSSQVQSQPNGNLHHGIKPLGSNSNITLAFLDDFISSQMESKHISGLSASVVAGNKTIWSKSFGLANRETGMEVTDSTLFVMLSVSKMFTGLTLMQLYEKGLFGLDDNINNYLPFEVHHPNYPEKVITFRMILTHSSGICEPFSFVDNLMVFGYDCPESLHDFLDGFFTPGGTYYSTSYFSNYEPGTQFCYSNVGATLAGYLAEIISGIAFNELCKDSLLTPMGMPNSSFLLADIDTNNLARAYDYIGNNYYPYGHISNPTLPAGFLRTNNRQMTNYLKTIINDGEFNGQQIIQPVTLDTMISDHFDPTLNVGLLFAYDHNFQTWGHSGGYRGTKTGVFFHREENWGVSLLTNGDGDWWDILYLLEQYAREFTALSLTKFEIEDDNENQLLESGEEANLIVGFRNALQHQIEDAKVILRSNNENIAVIDSIFSISAINPDEVINNQTNPFKILVDGDGSYQEVILDFIYLNGDVCIGMEQFPVYIGQPEVLLIDDEEHCQRNYSKSIKYYKEVLDETGDEYYFRNLTLSPIELDFINQFQKVIWFTGVAGCANNMMPEWEQQILMQYLDQGGNLLLSSQNAGDCCGNTTFFSDYLKTNHLQDTYQGALIVEGTENDTIGDDLLFYLNGGDGNNANFSASVIEEVNGGIPVFNYYGTANICGMRFHENYKSLFLPWGIEGLSTDAQRTEILSRALLWFDNQTVGIKEPTVTQNQPAILAYPNPCSDYLTIALPDYSSDGFGIFEIRDIFGNLQFTKTIDLTSEISIPLKDLDLPAGSYVIHLIAKKINYSEIVLIRK